MPSLCATALPSQDRACDALLQLLLRILPCDAVVPGSLRQWRRVLGIPRPADYEYHACPNDKCFWPPLPKAQWRVSDEHRCECQLPRFQLVRLPNGKTEVVPTGRVSGHQGRARSSRVVCVCVNVWGSCCPI